MKKYLKPSEYAEKVGLNYRTVIKHFYKGYIDGYKDKNTGSIFLLNPNYTKIEPKRNNVILYARVSNTNNKASLDGQLERMRNYASAKGYTIVDEVTKIASGLNDNRKKLNKVLNRNDWQILLVEHKDRLTRFGFNYFSFLEKNGQCVEAINQNETKNEEIVDDFISIISSFCGRIYGSNRTKKTNEIIDKIKEE